MTTTEQARALDALKHSGARGGWDDIEHRATGAFCEAYGPAKNGIDIIVRMTPEQALWFVDMIAEELD